MLGLENEAELILQHFRRFTYVTAHSTTLPLLHLRHRHFTYVTWRAPMPLWWCLGLIYPWWFCNMQWLRPAGLYEICKLALEQSSFSNISFTSPTSQLILQLFRRFTYVTVNSTTLPLLHLHHSLFSNLCHFNYVTTHSRILSSLYLRHSIFSNPSVASPTSQFILQPFFRISISRAHSPTFLSPPTAQLILEPFRRFT